MATAPRVTDNPRASRYELWLGATRAGLIDYRSQPGVVVLVHTEVDPALAGQGWASGWSPAPWPTSAPVGASSSPCGRSSVPTCAATGDQADLVAGDPAVPRVTMDRPAGDSRRGRADRPREVTVVDDRGRCRHYAECVGGLPQVFDPTRRPWIRADLADPNGIAEVVRRCPTGALHYRLAADAAEEPTRPTTITRDPAGPLLSAATWSWTPRGNT